MKPIQFLADADVAAADRKLVELLVHNLACSENDRFLILSWLSCYLLLDFTGVRSMTRFEGPAGSGKTTASKLISTLLYGEPQHKKATDAANYTDGSQNPLIALDNIEVKQMTDDLTTFLLTSITGVAKEKRKSGTDTETVMERTKCLVNTTGIKPLRGELSEILSRSFIITFDLANQAGNCFLEGAVLLDGGNDLGVSLSSLCKNEVGFTYLESLEAEQVSRKTVNYNRSGASKLPEDSPVVYRIKTDRGRTNYIGSSKKGRVQERISEHLDAGKVPGAKVEIEQMASIEEARKIEARAIARTKPKYNKKGGG